MSAITVLSFVGMCFFTVMFCAGFVLSWSRDMNSEYGRNLMFCLLGAVICAYLGGW